MITYTVQRDGTAWKIAQGTLVYTGYKSEESATKAAIAVATKLGLNGEATFVELAKPDGTSERVFASDPEPPTLDSMLRSAGYVAA
ncbi:hypothetical protein [Roseomonas xinghualingensis]|uniref:hypothetical protein n=1 Tax=Roseomonas xinghualingensis TaxID=2986475 RepID=UPI0021F2396F|nr:hypothetical protein [Roseomonas sp. SXEYE001]MCV4210396.1 hypothetical protein [Roseomonas sp. SXEYE001]